MFFAWVASVIYGFNTIIGKLTSKHVFQNPWLVNFVWQLFILIGIVPIALYYGVGMPVAWGSIIVAGIFSFLTGTLYILALYQLDVSIISPLYNFRAVFTALLGAAFLNEVLGGSQYMLVAIIFIGGILLNVDERLKLKAFFRKQVMIGLLAVLASALYGFTIKNAVAANGFWETSLWVVIVTQVILLGTIPLFYKDVRSTPIRSYAPVVLMGFLNSIGDLAANKAFASNVTIASAIISLPFSMLIAYLFSILAPTLLEKHTHKVYAIRFIAAAVMIWAAIKLS